MHAQKNEEKKLQAEIRLIVPYLVAAYIRIVVQALQISSWDSQL